MYILDKAASSLFVHCFVWNVEETFLDNLEIILSQTQK